MGVGVRLDPPSACELASASALNLLVKLWPLWLIVALILVGRAAKFVWADANRR